MHADARFAPSSACTPYLPVLYVGHSAPNMVPLGGFPFPGVRLSFVRPQVRYFVLLSTRKLLYYESDSSTKQRGAIDLQTATAARPIPDEFYNYDDAIEVVTSRRRWILCPESKQQQRAWLEALIPMIGGASAAEPLAGASTTVGGYTRAPTDGASGRASRGRGTSMVVGSGELRRGWLERQEEGGVWVRRYFVLEVRTRDGTREASLEYYLDEALTPDEDSETIDVGPGTQARQVRKQQPTYPLSLSCACASRRAATRPWS